MSLRRTLLPLAALGVVALIPVAVALGQEARTPRAEAAEEPARPEPTYSHPLGLSIWHPKGWSVEESALGLSLVPPGFERGRPVPREVYLMNAIGMPDDVKSLDDPRVAKRLNDFVRESVPFLEPVGKPRALERVPGARTFRWRGVEPTTRTEVAAFVHGRPERGYFVSLGAIGESALVAEREADVLRIFETLEWGAPKTSAKLVGTWHADSYHSAGDVSSDRVNVSHRSTFVFLADGRVRSSSVMGVSGRTGGDDGDGADVSGVVEGDPGLGRWAAKGKHLWLLWREGGAAKYEVFVQGAPGRREMLLTPAGGGAKVLWTEY